MMSGAETDTALVELAEREAIRDCLYRSALANDMCDAELWKSTYWSDGHEDHTPMFVGNAHEFVDAIIPMITQQMERTWHQVGASVIRIEGAQARAISYANVFARLRPADDAAAQMLYAGVRYVDLLEKRAGEWRILRRITQTDWIDTAPDVGGAGARDPADPARALFAAHRDQLRKPILV